MDEQSFLLIVDDSQTNLKIISSILKEDGYQISLALDGQTALEILKEVDIDLILLDIMMPEMNGYDVCLKIKETPELKDIPVIFISALDGTEDIVKAFNVGGADYIAKPFQSEEVKARVRTHIKIRKQNKALVKLNADKNRFISILAHDLRNPFNALLGYSELLRKKIRKYDIDDIEKKVMVIHKYANHIYDLLEDTLLWASAQSGRLVFEPQKHSLSGICNEIIENFKLIADVKSITIHYSANNDILIYADLKMLNTILRNLVSNALKYTNPGGHVIISSNQNAAEVVITVSDDGVGMSPNVLQRLFDMAQMKSTLGTANEKGSGLGLLLCKEFIEKHQGRIWAESELGKGSNFIFTIPFAPANSKHIQ